MELKDVQIIEDALSVLIDIDVREKYSGRCMFGESTSGIIVESESEFVSAIGEWLRDMEDDEIETAKNIGRILADGYSTDSMGSKIIIY